MSWSSLMIDERIQSASYFQNFRVKAITSFGQDRFAKIFTGAKKMQRMSPLGIGFSERRHKVD
jgi:hypothetical protein